MTLFQQKMDPQRIQTIMENSQREVIRLQVILYNLFINLTLFIFKQKFNHDYNESNPVTIFPDPPLQGLIWGGQDMAQAGRGLN